MKQVYIKWYDAYTVDSWQSIEEATEIMRNKYLVETIGWVLEETKKHISICHSYTKSQVMGALHIPRECIVKIKEIKGLR